MKKTYCFDLDGTLCTQNGTNYELAEPIAARVDHVNQLYLAGHRIIIHTARGSGTGVNQECLTRNQLNRWGVLHHELVMGKPAADLYIDDRGMAAHVYDWQ